MMNLLYRDIFYETLSASTPEKTFQQKVRLIYRGDIYECGLQLKQISETLPVDAS